MIKNFGLSLILALSSLLGSSVALGQDATKTYYVNPIQISGLSALRNAANRSVQNNLYVTVYYGIGRRASLNNQGDQITLREIKDKKTLPLKGDTLDFPEINLKRSNVFISFNIVVFVVHVGPQFTWVNANGQPPEGQTQTEQRSFLNVDSMTQPEFQSLIQKQNALVGQAVKYSFGAGVPEDL